MSPDIEWHVDEDDEQETIAQTSNARRSHLSRWVVISAIGLGVGLGLLYRSIPEPPPKPIGSTPTPTVVRASPSPQSTPESLDAAIGRDALRLSTLASEANHFITFAPVAGASDEYAEWYAALQNEFGRWGAPPYQRLYGVLERGTLSNGAAWAKLVQFRLGNLYRHTRFYRWENDRWNWTLPDPSFWNGMTAKVSTGDTGTIGPMTIEYPIEDAAVIGPVFDRFTRVYQNLCESLKCPPPVDPERMWTPGLTLSITIRPMIMQPVVQERSDTALIDLPSPRVVGYYDDANTPGDPYMAMAYATLIDPVVRLASGDYARWETDRGGRLFLQAIATWKRARLPGDLYLLEMFFQSAILPPSVDISPDGWLVSRRDYYVNRLRGTELIPLTDLWTWPITEPYPGTVEKVATQEVEAVIVYIEEKYGRDGVVRFLNALGKARSLTEAVETALPMSFGEFNQRWMEWIAGG